jgi:hypothetical protein
MDGRWGLWLLYALYNPGSRRTTPTLGHRPLWIRRSSEENDVEEDGPIPSEAPLGQGAEETRADGPGKKPWIISKGGICP